MRLPVFSWSLTTHLLLVANVQVPKPVVAPTREELRDVFTAFATFGNRSSAAGTGPAELDGPKFAKLCRESRLLDSHFSATLVDIIFTRVKPKVLAHQHCINLETTSMLV